MRLADRVATENLCHPYDAERTGRFLADSRMDERTAKVLAEYGVVVTEDPDTGALDFPKTNDPTKVRAAMRALELERKGLDRTLSSNLREMTRTNRKMQQTYAKWLSLVPVVAVDNVYRWWQTNDVAPEDATLVPRWPSFWIEYAIDRQTQIGVLASAHENEDPDAEDRWEWKLDVFVGDPSGVIGPMSYWTITADQYGRPLAITPTAGNRTVGASVVPVWAAALSLLNCKNVDMVRHDPSPGEQRKHRRKRGASMPLVGYHVIKVNVGRGSEPSKPSGDGANDDAFHICAGCLAHYGNCCPGTHPPHGKLFGQHTGRFFRPAHARGNRSVGVRVTDYEVTNLPG
jgi:hypothetical protein